MIKLTVWSETGACDVVIETYSGRKEFFENVPCSSNFYFSKRPRNVSVFPEETTEWQLDYGKDMADPVIYVPFNLKGKE